MEDHSIHKLTIEGIGGKQIAFSDFVGRKILIVNVASECGFTPQYAQLQELYEAIKDQLVIIACPSNDFGGQEPGDENAIQHFCEINYGVRFPLTKKINIKKDPIHPLYQWLTSQHQNGVKDATVNWNFNKFLLDENGHLIDHFPSSVSPFDEAILSHFTIN